MFLYVNPILLTAAVVPAVILLSYVYKSDRLDRESPKLLLSLVLYGVLATFGALVTESIGTGILDSMLDKNSALHAILFNFGVIACSEEGFKYLLLKRRTWKNPEFNCQYDGVVYAVFVSLGFALWENIGYVMMYGLSTALVRAITAVPGHACFGVFMGAFYGAAKSYDAMGMPDVAKRMRLRAFIVPVALHGGYDFIASSSDARYAWLFVPFIAVVFFISWRLIKRLSRDDRYITRRGDFIP